MEFYNYRGYTIVPSPGLCKTVQRRVHHKHRINKKWRKRYGYKSVPETSIYMSGTFIYMHPKYYKTLVKNLEETYGRKDIKT